MSNINEGIRKFTEQEKIEAEKALKTEKNQVCIKADSYVAKEIKYQTALLHQIINSLNEYSLSEKTGSKFSSMSNEELCEESFCKEKKPCEWRELHKELKKKGHYGISIVKRYPILSRVALQCAGAVIGSMVAIIFFKLLITAW